jgi:hypothetical protein
MPFITVEHAKGKKKKQNGKKHEIKISARFGCWRAQKTATTRKKAEHCICQ